jgi:glycosyltransferase involved in cell wall biosynthesis
MGVFVSIIIPTFNEKKNIGRLLLSIKSQTYKNIETIVVDDGSKDKTVAIAKKYSAKVFSRKHAERSAQRNYGAEKSSGKYLLFLDADMELTELVVERCVKTIIKTKTAGITIAERTVGEGIIPKIRNFEREMYMGDPTIEVPRFFDKKIFFEFGGYDLRLTGPEDYDLPYRIGKKYKLSRTNEYILHHEEGATLMKLLKRKYYYASKGAVYASKHPELIATQGNTLIRGAYFRNWKKFLISPVLGILFISVRILETIWAVAGYISVVGFLGFLRSLTKLLW